MSIGWTKEENPTRWVQGEYAIRLSDTIFSIEGPDIVGSQYGNRFDTWQKAANAIEETQKAAVKSAKTVTNIPVLDSEGNACTIRGLHSGTSKLLGEFPNGTHELFPNDPRVAKLLKVRADLLAEVKKINTTLKPVAFGWHPYGRRLDSAEYDAKLKEVLGLIEKAKQELDTLPES